jgi:hypothetical protein
MNNLVGLYNVYGDSQFFLNQRYSILNSLSNNLFISQPQNNYDQGSFIPTNSNTLNSVYFQKNFFQNTYLYYPTKSNFVSNSKINEASGSINPFYTLNIVDFLQKQDTILVLNLNTTSMKNNHFFFNKNESNHIYKS